MTVWFVDSSVLLRIVKEGSDAGYAWFDVVDANADDTLVASSFMEVETRHVVAGAGLDQSVLSEYLDAFDFLPVDEDLMGEALRIPPPVRGADSVHLAAALRIASPELRLVTHDRQMAEAAARVGLTVHDPITDDPGRPPVG